VLQEIGSKQVHVSKQLLDNIQCTRAMEQQLLQKHALTQHAPFHAVLFQQKPTSALMFSVLYLPKSLVRQAHHLEALSLTNIHLLIAKVLHGQEFMIPHAIKLLVPPNDSNAHHPLR
jgi:hypothetical protein